MIEDTSMDGMVINIAKDNKKTEILIKSDIKLKSLWVPILMLFIHTLLLVLDLFTTRTFDIVDTLVVMFFLLLNLILFNLLTAKEIIIISPKCLTISQKTLFFKRSSTYEKSKIKNFRSSNKGYSATNEGFLKKIWHMVLMKNGVITFDYINKEISFGSGLDVDQGNYLIETYLNELKKESLC